MMNTSRSALLVEDDRISSLAITRLLEKTGCRVTASVPTGEEALTALQVNLPDIILMDIQLKGTLDGIQCAEIINQNYNVPLVYLTAHNDDDTLERAKQTGPYGFISKPVTETELRTTLEVALAKYRLEAEQRNSRNLLSATFSAIRDGVITTGEDFSVQFMNPPAEKMAGENAGSTRNHEMDSLFILQDTSEKQQTFRGLLNRKPPPFTFSGKITGKYGSKDPFPMEFSVNRYAVSGKDTGGYVFVIRDTSEEHRFRTMKSVLASIVDSSPDAIIGIDWEGTVLSWNSGAEGMLGHPAGDIIGKNIALLTPPHLPDELPAHIDHLKENKNPVSMETKWKNKNGGLVDVQITLSVISDPNTSNAVSIIARNMTERRQLERKILEISEEERRRLGRDLHDSLGQHLAGTLFQGRFLHSALKSRGESGLAEHADRLESLLEEAVKQCRKIAKGFFPVTLESEGITGLLEELSDFTEQFYGIPVKTKIDDLTRLESGITSQLFRIAQEAVTNAARHGNPSGIFIELKQERGEIHLKIMDDGCGIPAEKTSGLGLKIMEYRTAMISGLLEIHSPPSGGTAIICRVPDREILNG